MSRLPKVLPKYLYLQLTNYYGSSDRYLFYPVTMHACYCNDIFTVKCGITHFLCAVRIFKFRTSSSPRLRLCQISFLSWPPLLS